METQGIWTENHQISASQTDTKGQANLVALANFLQEVAGNHAASRGLGFDDMQEKGRAWVLNRLTIHIDSYPLWRESIHIHTWVREMRGPFSYRDFEMLSEKGKSLLSASTLWIALDTQTRRPVRLAGDTDHFPILDTKRAIPRDPIKLSPEKEEEARIESYRVQYSDLDMLDHVNNVKYLAWILDTYSHEFWNQYEPKRLEINFLEETHYQDEIAICSWEKNDMLFHHSCKRKDKDVFRAIIHWGPRK